MNAIITKPPSAGLIRAIPSKSVAHRLLICAHLSGLDIEGICRGLSEDLDATTDCLKALDDPEVPVLDCRESGSTLRFLLPLCGALRSEGILKGSGRLLQRPLNELEEVLRAHGCEINRADDSIMIRGRLRGGDFTLPGNVSSQYVTGLLFALPLLDEDNVIWIRGELQSAPYVELTLDAMRRSGVRVVRERYDEEGKNEGDGNNAAGEVFRIAGGQKYALDSLKQEDIEGDWSNGAFWLVAKALGADIDCEGLEPDSIQGDRKILEIIDKCKGNGELSIDIGQTPDLAPAIALLAMGRGEGEITRIVNAGRLRMKESDRIASVVAAARSLGAKASASEDEITVTGCGDKALRPESPVDSFNDHRIVMMAAIGALFCKDPVEIRGCEAVRKSYPGFFEDYVGLGGNVRIHE